MRGLKKLTNSYKAPGAGTRPSQPTPSCIRSVSKFIHCKPAGRSSSQTPATPASAETQPRLCGESSTATTTTTTHWWSSSKIHRVGSPHGRKPACPSTTRRETWRSPPSPRRMRQRQLRPPAAIIATIIENRRAKGAETLGASPSRRSRRPRKAAPMTKRRQAKMRPAPQKRTPCRADAPPSRPRRRSCEMTSSRSSPGFRSKPGWRTRTEGKNSSSRTGSLHFRFPSN